MMLSPFMVSLKKVIVKFQVSCIIKFEDLLVKRYNTYAFLDSLGTQNINNCS